MKSNTQHSLLCQSKSCSTQSVNLKKPYSIYPQESKPCASILRLEEVDAQGDASGGGNLISSPSLLSNSIDTLHISLKITGLSKLISEMKESKELLQSGNDQEMPFEFLKNGSTHFQWNIQRSGIPYYPYMFKCGDIRLCLSARPSDHDMPNAQLMIGSISCQQGSKAYLNNFKFWMSCIDIHVIEEKISRLDLCVDIATDIKNHALDDISRFITRARDSNIHHSNRAFNSIVWGSGDIMCRIYDKSLELLQTKSCEKIMFFSELWGGFPKNVTRVEFQLRRGAIKSFFKGSTSLEHISARLGDLWEYLTFTWLRHNSGSVDRENRHQDRSELSPFWLSVQQADFKKKKPLTRRKSIRNINIPALTKQAVGCLLTAVAGIGQQADCFFEVITTVQELVSKELSGFMADPSFARNMKGKYIASNVTF